MNDILFITGFFLTLAGLFVIINEKVSWSSILLIIIGVSLMILTYIMPPNPTALDVYRGRTELKITSVNGVPVDTVVVFKEKVNSYDGR